MFVVVVLGIGNAAVQIMGVDPLHQIAEHVALFGVAHLSIPALARDDDEICRCFEMRIIAEGLDQRGDILFPNRPRNRENDWTRGVAQERCDECLRLGAVIDELSSGARSDPVDRADAGAGIGEQLSFAFIARRPDDRVRRHDRGGFLRDPRIHGLVDDVERCGLVTPERMRGVDEGDAEHVAHRLGHLGSVGKVRVNDIGAMRAGRQVGNQGGGEGSAVRGQLFLGKIVPVATVDPGDHQLVGDLFADFGMLAVKRGAIE